MDRRIQVSKFWKKFCSHWSFPSRFLVSKVYDSNKGGKWVGGPHPRNKGLFRMEEAFIGDQRDTRLGQGGGARLKELLTLELRNVHALCT